MLTYAIHRFLLALLTIWAISVLAFAIIQLPPGDYVTAYIAQLASSGVDVTPEFAENLRQQYGLDSPIWVQYLKWMEQISRGNFGRSLEWRAPVLDMIGDRLWLTMAVSVSGAFHLGAGCWIAFIRPLAVFEADYSSPFIGFIGLAVPSFLLALISAVCRLPLFLTPISGGFVFAGISRWLDWSFRQGLESHQGICRARDSFLGMAGTAS